MIRGLVFGTTMSAALALLSPPAWAQSEEPAPTPPDESGNLLEEPASEGNLLGGDSGGDNLLAGGGGGGEAGQGTLDSFAAELGLLGFSTTWSGYGDSVYVGKWGRASDTDKLTMQRGTFDAWHFNPILGTQLGEKAYAEAELELEHGGAEIKVEYAFLDLKPTEWLTIRSGKFLLPIGEFNDTLHPSFRWNQVTRPKFFREALPAVWSEVGVDLYGHIGSATNRLSYDFYVVNGLGDNAGGDWAAQKEPLRKLRDNTEDNNINQAIGGRIALRTQVGESIELRLGGSGYTGKFDDAQKLRLTIVDVHFSAHIGEFMLLGEAVQSFINNKSYTDANNRFEHGAYLQASYSIDKITLAARWSLSGHRPNGAELTSTQYVAPSIKWAPETFWSLRAELLAPLPKAGEKLAELEANAMVSFMF